MSHPVVLALFDDASAAAAAARALRQLGVARERLIRDAVKGILLPAGFLFHFDQASIGRVCHLTRIGVGAGAVRIGDQPPAQFRHCGGKLGHEIPGCGRARVHLPSLIAASSPGSVCAHCVIEPAPRQTT